MPKTEIPEAFITLASRRSVVAGLTLTLAGLTAGPRAWAKAPQKAAEAQSTGVEGLLTYLHQEVEFNAPVPRIYEALLDAKQFAAFTGMRAEINREAGGAFSTFGGLIQGRNVELIANQRIVQAWRPASWDPGVYSIVKFEIQALEGKTKVVLDHTGFPEGNFRHLDAGWPARYWEPMKKFFAQ